jgi:hypothetical protein
MSGDMSPDAAPLRWVVVTRPDRSGLLDELAWRYRYAPWVEVLADRRRGERRRRQEPCASEFRRGERRGVPGDRSYTPAFRLVRQGDGFDVYEATGYTSVRCPECGAMAMFELPRSGEPPGHLNLHVVHDPASPLQYRARHIVELNLYTVGGRPLLASRIFARTRADAA